MEQLLYNLKSLRKPNKEEREIHRRLVQLNYRQQQIEKRAKLAVKDNFNKLKIDDQIDLLAELLEQVKSFNL